MANMAHSMVILMISLPWLVQAGFWRMNCGKIQVGRIDPVVSPGSISGHVHNIVGAYSTSGAQQAMTALIME
jgi:hypothetical protein